MAYKMLVNLVDLETSDPRNDEEEDSYDDDHADDDDDDDDDENNSLAPLYTTITTFTIMVSLIVLLLILAVYSLCQRKKRNAQRIFGLGMVEGLTEGWNITVICTNESNSENQIQLLCNLEIFICSSMDVSQEKFTIDQSSIQVPGIVFKARGEGAPNSLLASYSCQSKDWVNMSTVFSTVPDPNTTTVPVSQPGTISWHKSSKKQPTKPKEELESHLPKENKKDKPKTTKPGDCNKNPNGRGAWHRCTPPSPPSPSWSPSLCFCSFWLSTPSVKGKRETHKTTPPEEAVYTMKPVEETTYSTPIENLRGNPLVVSYLWCILF
ncbi:uncharacterized protein [Aquarana catesbeiana]|uniref:uncharacterized protein n=1 Tax=Aquarana catesbeiana TaxID=8400 RepID=UPI003CC9E9C2